MHNDHTDTHSSSEHTCLHIQPFRLPRTQNEINRTTRSDGASNESLKTIQTLWNHLSALYVKTK